MTDVRSSISPRVRNSVKEARMNRELGPELRLCLVKKVDRAALDYYCSSVVVRGIHKLVYSGFVFGAQIVLIWIQQLVRQR